MLSSKERPHHPTKALWGLGVGLVGLVAWIGWVMFAVAGYRDGRLDLPAPMGSKVEVLEHQGGGLSLAQARELPEAAWVPWKGGYLPFFAREALWIRVSLVNPTPTVQNGVLADSEYLTDRIEAWMPGRDGETVALEAGESVAGSKKAIWGRTAAFPVTLAAGERATIYLRVSDFYDGLLWLRWWPDARDFYQAQLRDSLAEMLAYGWLLALVIYNFVLWARLRYPDMGYYVLYAGAMLGFNFASNGGFALMGVAIASPQREIWTAGMLALSAFSFAQFGRIFLGVRDVLPRMDHWLKGTLILLLCLLGGVALMVGPIGRSWLDVTILLAAWTHLLLFVAAVGCWRKGVRHARYFIFAFGLLLAGGLPAAYAWLSGDMQAWAAMALLSGALLEMSLLSFAVADRFAQTQRRLVEETQQRQMIQETYADELEIEICERTRELAKAAEDKDRILSILGHDLRSPLHGLLRLAERRGEGLANEVEETTRALLKLVENLVLWGQLHAGMWSLKAHPLEVIITPVIALHRSIAEERGVRLELRVPAGAALVSTDLLLAQTLLRNLISNAIKFSSSLVEVSVRIQSGQRVEISIANDGARLPASLAAMLQDENPERLPVDRLGLRLCIGICRILETRLAHRLRSDGLTEFGFALPITPSSYESREPQNALEGRDR